ncbi:MAG: hypothetical protein LUD47_07865 [Clostridia bacterium]|nr:hypothetical protein [Clostridia bacterium]
MAKLGNITNWEMTEISELCTEKEEDFGVCGAAYGFMDDFVWYLKEAIKNCSDAKSLGEEIVNLFNNNVRKGDEEEMRLAINGIATVIAAVMEV